MQQVSEEFIRAAYKDACSSWKDKIEAQFPEMFPKTFAVTEDLNTLKVNDAARDLNDAMGIPGAFRLLFGAGTAQETERGLFLDPRYDWEFRNLSGEGAVLIPHLKGTFQKK